MIRALILLFVLVVTGCADEVHLDHERPIDDPDYVEKAGTISCAARSDRGYDAGSAFGITVITVDGKPVEKRTAEGYWKMQQAAARDGVFIRIVSGFRTNGEQQYLYGCYVNCNCNNCNLAARPGYSNHQSGYAVDLNTEGAGVYRWLARNAGRFGFERTVPSEDWHWEFTGRAPAGAWPCGGAPAQPAPPAASGAGTYTVGWGGSCWEAAEQLGCGAEALTNCTSGARTCDNLWAGDRLACGASACAPAAAPAPSAPAATTEPVASPAPAPAPAPAPECRGYRVPSGGSCWDAADALGCAINRLRNTTAARSCAGLWAGDVLTCGCAPGAGSSTSTGPGRPSVYRVPAGGTCEGAAQVLGCDASGLVNCTMPGSSCGRLWAGDILACSAEACQ